MQLNNIDGRQMNKFVKLAGALFLLMALWIWLSSDTSLVDRRLRVSTVVTGGEVEVQGVVWEQLGPVWVFLLMRLPVAGISFDVLLENTSSQDLEVMGSFVILRDPFGREVRGELIDRTTYRHNPMLIPAGKTMPFYVGIVNYPGYPFQPLTWTQAEVHVKMKPASQRALFGMVRWTEVIITTAEYDEEGLYHIAGEVPGVFHVTENKVVLAPRVVISFYNNVGEYISVVSISIAGGKKDFDRRYDNSHIRNGPIASYVVHIVEAR